MFLMVADNHHEDGRVAVWLMATADAREAWLEMEPERFFVPPYVGPSGWLGVSLHKPIPWPVVEELIAEAARLGGAGAGRSRGKGRPLNQSCRRRWWHGERPRGQDSDAPGDMPAAPGPHHVA
ncbi:MAG: MmcQ/YjbR family DNA-binding protein [Polyangiaceae bacterium]|nr:MmcQ/YjbR family DNA-binding protein [Polyangiaceae bacterium]